MNGVDWNYFNKFDQIADIYLPRRGEGKTLASQLVTAVCKLVYKWYNDGDVFDNNHGLEGWMNDLSSFANWLYKNIDEASPILDEIYHCKTEDDYEFLLKDLADTLFDKDLLLEYDAQPAVGTIYDCDGPFRFTEYDEDEDEYEDDEYEDDEYDEEESDEY